MRPARLHCRRHLRTATQRRAAIRTSVHSRRLARLPPDRRAQHRGAKRTWLPQRNRLAYSPTSPRLTNRRGSDVDGPIHHAKPDRRTHIHEVPHTRAVPHRPDTLQPPPAAALQRQAGEPRPSRKRREPAPRQRPAAQSGTRTSAHSLELRYSHLPAIRRPLPARQEPVHLLHPRLIYASELFPYWSSLSPCNEQTRKHVVRFMNGCSAGTLRLRGQRLFCAQYRVNKQRSGVGTKRTSQPARRMSASGGKAENIGSERV